MLNIQYQYKKRIELQQWHSHWQCTSSHA